MNTPWKNFPSASVLPWTPVLLMMVPQPLPADFSRALSKMISLFDVQAQILIIPSGPWQRRTQICILGEWACSHCQILDALTAFFCQEASSHA